MTRLLVAIFLFLSASATAFTLPAAVTPPAAAVTPRAQPNEATDLWAGTAIPKEDSADTVHVRDVVHARQLSGKEVEGVNLTEIMEKCSGQTGAALNATTGRDALQTIQECFDKGGAAVLQLYSSIKAEL